MRREIAKVCHSEDGYREAKPIILWAGIDGYRFAPPILQTASWIASLRPQ
jgi:hypothetical protein